MTAERRDLNGCIGSPWCGIRNCFNEQIIVIPLRGSRRTVNGSSGVQKIPLEMNGTFRAVYINAWELLRWIRR
jgi:hypothetical protein